MQLCLSLTLLCILDGLFDLTAGMASSVCPFDAAALRHPRVPVGDTESQRLSALHML